MTCPLCVELYESFQRALELSLQTDDERVQSHKRYRWRIYRAHAAACGGGK